MFVLCSCSNNFPACCRAVYHFTSIVEFQTSNWVPTAAIEHFRTRVDLREYCVMTHLSSVQHGALSLVGSSIYNIYLPHMLCVDVACAPACARMYCLIDALCCLSMLAHDNCRQDLIIICYCLN